MTNEKCDFDLNNNPNLSFNNPNSSSACCSNASCSSNIYKSQQSFQKKMDAMILVHVAVKRSIKNVAG